VVMRLNRTGLGRHLRRSASIWRGCEGTNKREIVESIHLAAAMARDHLHRQSRSLIDA
jgi:hypothetical protein